MPSTWRTLSSIHTCLGIQLCIKELNQWFV
ncbi:unnamed protein product, partial [Vitis vinifera]